MKKIKYILGFFAVLVLTGCVKYNTKMEIKNDNSVELTMTYSIQSNLKNSDGSNIKLNIKNYKFLEKNGFSTKKINESLSNGNKISGIIIYKKFKSLEDMSTNEKFNVDFIKIFQDEDPTFDYDKFFYKKDGKYNASFIFDFMSNINISIEDISEDISDANNSISNKFDLKYSISFPEHVTEISSNATKTSDDGHELTWDLDFEKANNIEFSFVADKPVSELDKIIILSCLGVIGGSFLIIVIVLLTKIGDKKKIDVDQDIEKIEEEQ